MGRRDGSQHPATAAAREEDPTPPQTGQGLVIAPAASALTVGSVGATDIGTLIPVKTKPAQIPQNGFFRARLEPRTVQVVNPEEKRSTLKTAMEPGQKRCA